MNENYKTLDQFLNNHRCQKSSGQEHTHTSIGSQDLNIYGGSYTIPEKDKCKFYELYTKHVFVQNKKAYLTEKHNEHSPILIDLDFRFDSEIIDRQYDDNVIISFLKLYVNELVEYVNVDKSKINAFVLEKTVPVQNNEKGYTKDGIHIIFPNVVTSPNIQYVLRYKMLNNKKCKQLFQNINITNPIEDIFDVAVIERNNWQMYGSTKPGCEPYKLSKIYSFMEISNEFKIVSNDQFSNEQLVKLLSIQQFNESDLAGVHPHKEEEFNNLFEKLPAKHRKRKQRTINITKKKKKSPKIKNLYDENTIKLVKELVDILSVDRADDHNTWMQVGWCLHNIDYDLLDTWIKFSSKSEKSNISGTDHGRSSERCKYLWDDMYDEGLNIGSLYLWAKEDNFEKYKELKSKNLRVYLLKSLNMTHHDIAQVIFQKYKHDFVCSSSKKKSWYQFKNHRWNSLDDNVELKRKISTEIVNEYLKLASEVAKEAAEMHDDDDQKDQLMERVKKISSIALKLKVNNFKKNVLDECVELFYKNKFEEQLDTKINLIGFENGVYDLEKHEFRDGTPEDYISVSTGICYEEYKEDDDDMLEVNKFISQVLPKKDVREYVITLLSSFLSGKTGEEKFQIWTGSGGNGKSKLIELFELAFGEYCCTLPITVLTRGRGNSGAADPALERTKGKRFACLQEPEHRDTIHVGLMKELTGGDKIIARGLYKDPVEFKPQFKLVLTCNELPEIPATDRGTWRRIRVVEFISKFTENPDPNQPYEFPIDTELSDKLREWPEAFMYLLLQRHKIYVKQGLKEPKSVIKNTEDYQNESDLFKQFANERLIEIENYNGEGLKCEEILWAFTEWNKQAYGGQNKVPKRNEIKANLIKRYGKPENNVWKGLTIRDESNSKDHLDF